MKKTLRVALFFLIHHSSYAEVFPFLSSKELRIDTPSFPYKDPFLCHNEDSTSLPVDPSPLDWIFKISQFKNNSMTSIELHQCSDFPNGENELILFYKNSLKKGLSCLMKMKSEETDKEVKLIIESLKNPKKPIQIYCGQPGQSLKIESKKVIVGDYYKAKALSPPEAGSPGMIINQKAFFESNRANNISTLFHETLHWTGARHSQTFDTPYIADACCFSEKLSPEIKKKACSLLQLQKRPSLYSEDYLIPFLEIMIADHNESIATDLVKTLLSKSLLMNPVSPEILSLFPKILETLNHSHSSSSVIFEKIILNFYPKLKDKIKLSPETQETKEVTNELSEVSAQLLEETDALSFQTTFDSLNEVFEKNQNKILKNETFKLKINAWMNLIHREMNNCGESSKTCDETQKNIWNKWVKKFSSSD